MPRSTAAFNSAKKQQFPTEAAFQTFLSQSGQTLNDILFRVRVNQIYMSCWPSTLDRHPALRSRPTTRVTFRSLGRRRLAISDRSHQQPKPGAGREGRPAGGQSCTAVAKKYSIDTTTKYKGGQLDGVTKGQEETALTTPPSPPR